MGTGTSAKPKLGAGGPQREFGIELAAPHHALSEYRSQRRQIDELLTVGVGSRKVKNGLKDGVEAPAQRAPITVLLIENVVGALRAHDHVVGASGAKAPAHERNVPEIDIDDEGPGPGGMQ